MHLIAFFQATQNGDGVLHVGLAHKDDLEAALQRGIFLDVFAVFVQRGCADGTQLAAGQRRFKHVAGVNCAFGSTCAYERMQFVNEENDLALRVFNFLEHGFQAVFKLAAILGARQHGAQIEGHHTLVLQDFRNVTGDDALCQAFHNGGLAHARFADQYRIVLGAAGKHLHHAADFFIAANHGIELAPARQFGQVFGIALQRLVFAFGILVGHSLRPAH